MAELTIICPNCKAEIPLTESLAAPLLEKTRRDFERKLSEKDTKIAERENDLRGREEALKKAEGAVDDKVAEKLKEAKTEIEADAEKKAKEFFSVELENSTKQITHLQGVLEKNSKQLKEALDQQAKLVQKEIELDNEKNKLALTVQKQVQEQLSKKYAEAKKEAEEESNLKIAEKEKIIDSMKKQIDELKHKAEQGSQQLQGEIQELALETMLADRFPADKIAPVPKGLKGADVIQHIYNKSGIYCGVILWESKNTKGWSNGWLAKLKHDQHEAKANLAVIVSQALPKEVSAFDFIDGVWVAHPSVAMPLALSLRQSLIETAAAQQAVDGQQTKMGLTYKYLTGPHFRQRVEAIVGAFSALQEGLALEKKTIMKQWAKREQEIGHAIEATAGMYGDLQGIAGKNLQEIEGLSLLALDDGSEP